MKEFPRYFTSVVGFGDETAYIEFYHSNDAFTVRKDGSRKKWGSMSLNEALGFCDANLWKEITEEEANKMGEKPFPQYFENNEDDGNWGTMVYVVCFNDKDPYTMVYENGREEKAYITGITHCKENVNDGNWKEITEEKAKSKVNKIMEKFPKYFVSNNDDWGKIAYVVCDNRDDKYVMIYKDGTKKISEWSNFSRCKDQVKDGTWKEITESEAFALVDGTFPKYYRDDTWLNTAYIKLDDKNSKCVWISYTGNFIEKNWDYEKCKVNVKNYGLKEISEEQAKSFVKLTKEVKKLPRYFREINDEFIYTIFTSETKSKYIDVRSGYTSIGSCTLSQFKEWAKEGLKVEMTEEEVKDFCYKNIITEKCPITISVTLTQVEIKELKNTLDISVLSGWKIGDKIKKAIKDAQK